MFSYFQDNLQCYKILTSDNELTLRILHGLFTFRVFNLKPLPVYNQGARFVSLALTMKKYVH